MNLPLNVIYILLMVDLYILSVSVVDIKKNKKKDRHYFFIFYINNSTIEQ